MKKNYNYILKNRRALLVYAGLTSLIVYAFLCSTITPVSYSKPVTQIVIVLEEAVMQSLDTAATLYVMKQKANPKAFSDFVTTEEKVQGKYTISLFSSRRYITKLQGMNTKKLTITYKPTGEGTFKVYNGDVSYFLNGSKVTMKYGRMIHNKK